MRYLDVLRDVASKNRCASELSPLPLIRAFAPEVNGDGLSARPTVSAFGSVRRRVKAQLLQAGQTIEILRVERYQTASALDRLRGYPQVVVTRTGGSSLRLDGGGEHTEGRCGMPRYVERWPRPLAPAPSQPNAAPGLPGAAGGRDDACMHAKPPLPPNRAAVTDACVTVVFDIQDPT